MIPLLSTLALALTVPAPVFDPDAGVPPGGGYWAPGEAPSIAPPDGEEQILIGAIMIPLGVLSAGSASPMVWATAPGHCPGRLEGWGINADAEQCKGLFIYNVIRLSYGAAAVITGGVFLAIGLQRRKALKEW
ncbi:MAG: hypothetical protein KUG77_11015 [Nannocystaceae bacterium]|nr:hypothetical protein [Nannocystaceae bacterium]